MSIKRAASVMLVRVGPPCAVLLGERPQTSVFMPNALVFPGGGEKAEDARFPRPLCNVAAELPLPVDYSLRVTALRELFEECCLLPVVDNQNNRHLLGYGAQDLLADCKRLNNKEIPFEEVMHKRRHSFRLDVDGTWPFSNWLTPFDYKIRFDNFIYLMYAPEKFPDSSPFPAAELHELLKPTWHDPGTLIEMARTGKATLAPPQAYEVDRLDRYAKAHANSLANLETLASDVKICPQLIDIGDHYIGILNDDQAYVKGANSTELPAQKRTPEEVRHAAELSKPLNRIQFKKKPMYHCVHLQNNCLGELVRGKL